jgi:hypothetical protein
LNLAQTGREKQVKENSVIAQMEQEYIYAASGNAFFQMTV